MVSAGYITVRAERSTYPCYHHSESKHITLDSFRRVDFELWCLELERTQSFRAVGCHHGQINLGQSEVTDFGVHVIGHENIAAFHIAMDDSAGVEVFQPGGRFHELQIWFCESPTIVKGQLRPHQTRNICIRISPDVLGQRAIPHVRRYQVVMVIHMACPDKGQDVRMAELSPYIYFPINGLLSRWLVSDQRDLIFREKWCAP